MKKTLGIIVLSLLLTCNSFSDDRDLNGDSFFRIYLRERGKLYDSYDLFSDQNIDTLTYKKYAMPLSDAIDINWDVADTDDTTADGYGVTIDWHAQTSISIGNGGSFNFIVTIDGQSTNTINKIYNGVMSKLRKSTDIDLDNTPVTLGQLADELLEFVGDTLYTKTGVVITNYLAADSNNIVFTDDAGVTHINDYESAGQLLFNTNLTTDTSPYFWMYVAATFPGAGALYVEDASATDIIGICTSTVPFTFAWTSNTQNGRTPDVDPMNVLVVATGLDKAQYVQATGTINKSKSNSISVNSVLERNYLDPA